MALTRHTPVVVIGTANGIGVNGGIGVLAVDRLIDFQGTLADMSPETIKRLDLDLPSIWSRANPVDIAGDADAERYSRAMSALLDDPAFYLAHAAELGPAPIGAQQRNAAARQIFEAEFKFGPSDAFSWEETGVAGTGENVQGEEQKKLDVISNDIFSMCLRNTGRTPGIVYGGEGQPQLIELDHNALWHALKKEVFHSSILDMELNAEIDQELQNLKAKFLTI